MDQEQLKSEGWIALSNDGFSNLAGPFWLRRWQPERTLGFVAEQHHVNFHGLVHGGVLMTFADVAMGCEAAAAIGEPRCVTASLQLQFVGAGRVGDFITCTPELVRKTSQLVFLRALVRSGDRTLASADGIWKILEPRPSLG